MGVGAFRGPRVVHVLEAYGGVETYLRLLIEHWSGSPDFAFVLAHEGDFAEELRRRGFPVHIVAMPRTITRGGELRAAWQLRRVLRDLDPGLVHLHSSQAGLIGRLAWARRGRPVVFTPHAYYYLGKAGIGRWIFLTAERILDRFFPTRLLATSLSEARRAVEEVGVSRSRTTALMNAVELPEAAPRRCVGVPTRVGLIGRVCPQKDLGMYLRVVHQALAASTGELHFRLAGVGHYPEDHMRLRAMMREAGVAEHQLEVAPWMPREECLAWMESCDVVVLTSAYESFGYALAEASARGIPVVGTDVDGIRDVVVENVSGHLVPAGDSAAMAEILLRLARDDAHYRRLSRGALDVARRRLDIRVLVDGLDGYYSRLCTQPRPQLHHRTRFASRNAEETTHTGARQRAG